MRLLDSEDFPDSCQLENAAHRFISRSVISAVIPEVFGGHPVNIQVAMSSTPCLGEVDT